jgi:orotate phosphoribosyltransferase
VALGGVSLAAACALQSGLAFLIVRPEAKAHGLGRLVEGAVPSSGRVVVIEDVATSGGSILRAVAALRALNLDVEEARVVVDREQGATEALKAEGIALRSLVTGTQIRETGARLAAAGGAK